MDDFVASFVGRDRDCRGLSFLSAKGVRVEDVPTVAMGAKIDGLVNR